MIYLYIIILHTYSQNESKIIPKQIEELDNDIEVLSFFFFFLVKLILIKFIYVYI